MRHTLAIAGAVLLVTTHCAQAQGQTQPLTVLTVDLQNVVEYQGDIGDPSKFATNPGITPSVQPRNFFVVTLIGDIVRVNGEPAKGMYVGRTRVILANPAPVAGGAIADVSRVAMREHYFEILKSDGTPVGTIASLGFSGGPAPPGTGTPSSEKANWAIVGGTGAFLGARGQVGGTGASGRAASMAEDPGNRRINGGTSFPFILHIIPMFIPQIVTQAGVPAIVHSSDFSVVTASKPAAAGEILSLFATGLGPTVPDEDTGALFTSFPLAVVNSPVTIAVNDQLADVVGAVGYPGSVGGYQVNFRIPPGTAKGLATIQLTVAWIAAAPVNIQVQ